MSEIIDFHTHIYPDKIANKVISGIETHYNVTKRHDATLSSLLLSLENGGVDKAVVLPVATKPEHVKYNKWYANLSKISKKIIPFGGIHPDNDLRELEKIAAMGLIGIKLQPNAQRFYPNEKRAFNLYKKAQELGLIVVFHIGREEDGTGKYAEPKLYVELLKSFLNLKIVLAHLGGYLAWDDLGLLLGHDNVYFDTAYLPGNIEDKLILRLIDKIGIDKVLFGTDFPFRDHKEEREYTQKLLGANANLIFNKNPKKLLGL